MSGVPARSQPWRSAAPPGKRSEKTKANFSHRADPETA